MPRIENVLMGGGFHTHWQTNHLRVVLKCYAAQDCKDGLEAGVSESPANDASFSDITGGHSHGGTRKTPMIQQAQQRMFWDVVPAQPHSWEDTGGLQHHSDRKSQS